MSTSGKKTIGDQIRQTALQILKKEPDGVRYSELVRAVSAANPKWNVNTIHGSVWDLDKQFPDTVRKPSRGLFRLTEFTEPESDELKEELLPKTKKNVSEDQFYGPFADWLKNELEECTKAIPLGGKIFKDKWGTPDVIGKRTSRKSDIIQAPVEIVSVEIKSEVSQLVVAFGQACAYSLFSHKSYLAVPMQAPQDDLARLDSLCQVFGIGLVLFDANKPKDPNFTIRVRARRLEPDLFYTNRYMKLIETELFEE